MSKKYEKKSNILKISNKEYLQKKEVLTSFFLNEEYVKMTEKQVANFFNVPKDECYILDKIISELEEEGVIYQDDSKRLVRLSDKEDILKCVYSSKSEKFGFCLSKDGNDVYISKSAVIALNRKFFEWGHVSKKLILWKSGYMRSFLSAAVFC